VDEGWYRDRRVGVVRAVGTLDEVVREMNGVLAEDEVVRGKTGGKAVKVRVERVGMEDAERRAETELAWRSQVFVAKNPQLWEVDLDGVRELGIELGGVRAFFAREKGRLREAVGL
jgi:hypothetical protein